MTDVHLDIYNMTLCLREAEIAAHLDEVPIGAMVVSPQGELLSTAHNLKEQNHDATAHAEIIAIQAASKRLGSWRLLDCTIYVTLEPCPMCLSAILQARPKRLVFGAYDKKGGAISLGYNFANDSRLNHSFEITGGIMHFETSKIISDFFRSKRKRHLEK